MITLAEAEYPVPMSEIQSKKKIQKASFTRSPHRNLLMMIYSCSLRIGETLNLQPADIKSAEGLIYIRGGKGKKDRRVPLSKRIVVCGELSCYHISRRYFDADQGAMMEYSWGSMTE